MAGFGTKITATDFNAIQSKVALILGSGSADYGYDQIVTSAQVAANAIVSVSQWNKLRTDIVKCRQHQNGITITNYSPSDVGYVAGQSLKIPTTSNRITEEDRLAYDTMVNAATTDRLAISSSPSQVTLESLTSSSRTANWNNTLTQTITIDFASATAARCFFNAGCNLQFSSTRSGGVGGPKDTSWTTILTGMGTIYFNRSTTTCSGTGNTSSIGWEDLTGSNQLIFSKDVSNATYYPNQFRLNARAPSPTQLVFTLEWADASGQPNAPWGTDEDVTGTLTSTVNVYRSTGDVITPKPSGTPSAL